MRNDYEKGNRLRAQGNDTQESNLAALLLLQASKIIHR